MAEVLQVERRETRGTQSARQMRKEGKIPAVLYGHGEETMSLTVGTSAVETAIRHGAHLVELAGAVKQSALIRELQWNTWGTEVLHVDFTRVRADEMVEVTVAVELRGEAPGVKEGGVVEHLIHEIELECKATDIPEKIEVNINHLEVDQSITVADLKIPEGGKCHLNATEVVVHCVVPAEVPEEEEGVEAGSDEPEIIGGRKEEEGEES